MREAHIPALAELEWICFASPWSAQSLRDVLANPLACFRVAEDAQGGVLGYAGMHHVAGECYVDNIAVFPQYRRQGVGERLVQALFAFAGEVQARFLTLEVRPSNGAAIALYQRFGMTEQGRRKNFYTAPAEDAIILTKFFEGEEDPCVSLP